MPAAVRVRTLIRAVTSMGSPVAGVTVPGLEGSVDFGSVGLGSVGFGSSAFLFTVSVTLAVTVS